MYLDTETFCEIPIKQGTYIYTESCECMLVSYAFDDGPVECWDVTTGAPMPDDLAYMLDDPDELITAHFAMFDRNVLRYALKRDIPIHRWRCTMTRALTHGLPGALDKLCAIFKLEEGRAKLKAGRQLIQLFCKPRPKNSTLRRATRETHSRDWNTFIDYARSDTNAMRIIEGKLPQWNYSGSELALWHLDQAINDRGICVDVHFAQAAIAAVEKEKARLARETQRLTGDVVESATKRDQLLGYIAQEHGIELPDMRMATLERRVNDPDLPIELRELLAIRLQASSTSTSKYTALVRSVQGDSRLRGTQQFSGAARTRRWAHRTFQPGNLPRPDMAQADIAFGIDAIIAQAEDLVVTDVMRLARNAVRGCIVAPPGKKLVISDLSNIEGRDAAWLAGEEWKLQAFRDYDAGVGADLYCVAYAKAFNVTPDSVLEDKKAGGIQRQIGKVMELMLQYEGGVGAFITGAATYNIDLDELAVIAWELIPTDVMAETVSFVEWYDRQPNARIFPIATNVRTVCDALKRMWRRQHPAIVALWEMLEDAAISATCNPGNTFECGKFKARRDGAWLRILLPSGRSLCYPSPQVTNNKLSYMGVNTYTKRWDRIPTYGGKLFENACQSFAGDVLKAAMPAMEAHGYEIVLTVHDEAVTETPDTDAFSVDELSSILAAPKDFAPGLPLAAAGFETHRYRKE